VKVERFHMDNVEDGITVYFQHVVTLPTDIPGIVIYVGSDNASELLSPGSGSHEAVRLAAREVVAAFVHKDTNEYAAMIALTSSTTSEPKAKAKKKARRKK
jgi:hypothetical protein